MAISIDTAQAAADLECAGFDRAQATAIVKTVADSSHDIVTEAPLDKAVSDLKVWTITTQLVVSGFLFALLRFTGTT